MNDAIDVRYEEIVIAALFHDLGKIAQRAGDVSCMTPSMDGQLLPKTIDDRYTHHHAWYTHGAILKIFEENPNFPKILRPEIVARVAARHHNPGIWAEFIIAESDRISSGADRLEMDIEAEQKSSYIEQAQLSIFSSVSVEHDNAPRGATYYSVSALDDANIHPSIQSKNDRERYAQVWANLLSDLRIIKENEFDAYLSAADAALEHWAWAIPSSTINLPDISLYDHARTTAAFSSALFRYHEANQTLYDQTAILNRKEKKYTLVSGDISGIQNYLFDLKTTKNSIKMLRARSFEIRAITDSAVRRILREFKMNRFCVLSNAGGRFLLVLPSLVDTESHLDVLRSEVDVEFLKRYIGGLSLSISSGVCASFDDFMLKDGSFQATFKNLQIESGKAKTQKLRKGLEKTGHVLNFYYSSIEKVIQHGGKVCDMCDIRPARENSDFCGQCESLIDAGGRLPKAVYLTLSFASEYGLRLLNNETLEFLEGRENVLGIVSQNGIYSVNRYEPGNGMVRLPYAVPRHKDGSVKDLSELSSLNEGSNYLAMFKADLDNLGFIFSQGLSSRLSISRYATLSRMLDYFFSVQVRLVIEAQYPNLYTVYSGGDDLCVIGAWQEIIDFVVEIQKEFTRFVGGVNDLTISGGIALVDNKLPVTRMNDETEEQLINAKDTPGKNRIAFLGLCITWDEFERLIATGKIFSKWLKQKEISTSLIYGFVYQSRNAEEFERGDLRRENALWKSHFLYNLKRAETRNKLSEEKVSMMKSFAVDAGKMKLARIPATYALYVNRESKNTKGGE